MIQRQFELLGGGGCYFFCLWELARRKTGIYQDPYRLYVESVRSGFLTQGCWVNSPAGVMMLATGQTDWNVRHENADYRAREYEYEILRYGLKTAGGEMAHFVLPDWDPYGESMTRLNGQVVSKRILWRRSEYGNQG